MTDLREVFTGLSGDHQEVLLRTFWDNWEKKKIAEYLGVDERTVRRWRIDALLEVSIQLARRGWKVRDLQDVLNEVGAAGVHHAPRF